MLNYLLEGGILGVSLLVIFVILEGINIAFGKELLIDKLIAYVENVYQRTAPNDHQKMDLRGCNLPEKVHLIELSSTKKNKFL